MKYFTLNELTRSDTATQKSILNTPNAVQSVNLNILISQLLDPIREAWGSPLKVNSGFRSEALNKAVGGSATSAHMDGWAADIFPLNGSITAFKEFVTSWAKDKQFDQIIIEKNSRGSEWIHIGLYNRSGQQRRQLFNMVVQ